MGSNEPSSDRVSGPEIRSMFSRIVGRYDLLNHLLSWNLDRLWRRKAVRLSRVSPSDRVLDVCSGTGDLALAFARRVPTGGVLATDFCREMLLRLPAKAQRKGMADRIEPAVADCMALPFRRASFDIVSVAFGIRNVVDPAGGIREMARVLVPGGRIVILEFSFPTRFPMRQVYGLIRKSIPWIARAVFRRNESAYQYLNSSVPEFAEQFDLPRIMERLGLVRVSKTAVCGGVVQIVVGTRPDDPGNERERGGR